MMELTGRKQMPNAKSQKLKATDSSQQTTGIIAFAYLGFNDR